MTDTNIEKPSNISRSVFGIDLPTETVDSMIAISHTLQKRMSSRDFDDCPIEDVVRIVRLVNNSKISSRFWERWIAKKCKWMSSLNLPNVGDYGDLLPTNGSIGIDNIELKVTERMNATAIGGEQHRFYENIPWYLYVKLDTRNHDSVRFYLLHKEEIKREIFVHRSHTPGISQGSGKLKGKTVKERLQMVNDTFNGKNELLWSFGVKTSDKASLERWKENYEVKLEELQNWELLRERRLYGI